MIKIEASTLEEAYMQAATSLKCSVTELKIEVVQSPSKGLFGLFSKKAIIVAIIDSETVKDTVPEVKKTKVKKENKQEEVKQEEVKQEENKKPSKPQKNKKKKDITPKKEKQEFFRDTIMPESFVSTQEDDDYDDIDSEDYEDELVETNQTVEKEIISVDVTKIIAEIDKDINDLFNKTCFAIDKIEVSTYDANTVLVEFKGDDAALLIGKEGYRYKALSYMIFNWLNTKYQVQLRLEIAEFLKNQEESVLRYLEGITQTIDRDGRAQTKILDGVLVQIALKELRSSYPNKYVAIRTTRDGLKYIIVNDYHN